MANKEKQRQSGPQIRFWDLLDETHFENSSPADVSEHGIMGKRYHAEVRGMFSQKRLFLQIHGYIELLLDTRGSKITTQLQQMLF